MDIEDKIRKKSITLECFKQLYRMQKKGVYHVSHILRHI